MRTETIRQLVARHAPTDGTHVTPLEGIQLFRVTHPVERLPAVYSPSVCVVVQGSKRAYLGDAVHVYSPGQYLCASMPMPVQAEVPSASPEEPLLGLLVSLETRTLAETVVEVETASGPLPHSSSWTILSRSGCSARVGCGSSSSRFFAERRGPRSAGPSDPPTAWLAP